MTVKWHCGPGNSHYFGWGYILILVSICSHGIYPMHYVITLHFSYTQSEPTVVINNIKIFLQRTIILNFKQEHSDIS